MGIDAVRPRHWRIEIHSTVITKEDFHKSADFWVTRGHLLRAKHQNNLYGTNTYSQ